MFKKLFGIFKKDDNKENKDIELEAQNNQAEEEAKEKAEAEAREKAEAEAKEKAEAEAQQRKQEQEAKERAKAEAKEKAEVEARERAEAEAKEKAEAEAKEKAEAEAKKRAEAEAKKKQEEESKHQEKDSKETDKKEKKGFFAKIKEGLAKTKENLTAQLNNVFHMYKTIDDDLLDEIEEILVTSDMGVELTMDIIDYIKQQVKENSIEDPNAIKGLIKSYLVNMLNNTKGVEDIEGMQKIIMVVGVNGVGKTTSIGKMSYRIKSSGKSVIVAAADTFRAAAVEQLKEWCNRADVDIIASENGSDPGSVIYDAIQAARARKSDVLICDTAGRLHNKVNLMNELTKMFKIVDKEYGHAQREVLLVVDATTGQNGLIQAKMFSQSCKIDGIILTKLDGTAKGGIVFPIVKELNVPIKYIGVGEKIDDMQTFDAEMFVDAIFE